MPCSGAPLLLFNNNVFLQKSAYILSVADIFRIYFRKRLIHAMSFISPDVWWSNWSSQDRQNFSSSHTWTISAELRATSPGMEPTSRQIKGVDADPKAPGLGSCVKWHCTGVSWVQCAPVKEKRPKMRWRLKAAGQQQCILNHPLITHTHTLFEHIFESFALATSLSLLHLLMKHSDSDSRPLFLREQCGTSVTQWPPGISSESKVMRWLRAGRGRWVSKVNWRDSLYLPAVRDF